MTLKGTEGALLKRVNLNIKVTLFLALHFCGGLAFASELCLQLFKVNPSPAAVTEEILGKLLKSSGARTPIEQMTKPDPKMPPVPAATTVEMRQLAKTLHSIAPDLFGKNFDANNEAHWNELVREGRLLIHIDQFLDVASISETQIKKENSDAAWLLYRSIIGRLWRAFNENYVKVDLRHLEEIEETIAYRVNVELPSLRLAKLIETLTMLDFGSEFLLTTIIEKRAEILSSRKIDEELRRTLVAKLDSLIVRQVAGIHRLSIETQRLIFERYAGDFELLLLFVGSENKLIAEFTQFFKRHLTHLDLNTMGGSHRGYQIMIYFERHGIEKDFVIDFIDSIFEKNKIYDEAKSLYRSHYYLLTATG